MRNIITDEDYTWMRRGIIVYLEYQSVWNIVWIESPHSLSRKRVCLPPWTQRGGGATLSCGWGGGLTQFGCLDRNPGTLFSTLYLNVSTEKASWYLANTGENITVPDRFSMLTCAYPVFSIYFMVNYLGIYLLQSKFLWNSILKKQIKFPWLIGRFICNYTLLRQ